MKKQKTKQILSCYQKELIWLSGLCGFHLPLFGFPHTPLGSSSLAESVCCGSASKTCQTVCLPEERGKKTVKLHQYCASCKCVHKLTDNQCTDDSVLFGNCKGNHKKAHFWYTNSIFFFTFFYLKYWTVFPLQASDINLLNILISLAAISLDMLYWK